MRFFIKDLYSSSKPFLEEEFVFEIEDPEEEYPYNSFSLEVALPKFWEEKFHSRVEKEGDIPSFSGEERVFLTRGRIKVL